jgi:glycerol-3-phosphate acyltransferase PlsX
MGGDIGLPVTIPAAVEFARNFPDTRLLLVGMPEAIEKALGDKAYANAPRDRLEIVPATEVVTMDDSVEVALRRKKDSSMRLAAQAVKDGRADACVSAGNTGAWMAISRYVLKTLEGIDRPAIARSLPNQAGHATVVLDLGANVDCTAEHLLQFAIMGAGLAQALNHRERPSVGLLNIGEEVIKGNEVVKEAAELLRASPLNFLGNVEGNDIFKGTVDVVVCDGFVGNAVLKAIEGLARMLGGVIRQEFKRNLITLLAGAIASPVLNRLRDRVDNRRYNGAALLGLRGVVIKSHGSADVYAYGFALQNAREAVVSKLLDRTTQTITLIRQQQQRDASNNAEPMLPRASGDTA